MGLEEALEELEDVDPDEFAEALQDEASPLYKAIRTPAYKKGQEDKEEELQNAQEKIASLRNEKKELETKIEELEESNPEEAEIRAKYEEKLKQKNQKIEELQNELEEVEENWRGRTQQVTASSFQEQLSAQLKALGVDEDYAEFKAEQVVNSNRVSVDADDDELSIEVYEDGDGTVPLHTNGEKPKHKAFAEELTSEVPDKFIEDNRPGSSGLGEPSSGGGQKIKRSEFEELSPAKQREYALNPDVEVVD